MWGSRVRASQGSQNLKENLKMFKKKKDFEDEERRELPDFWKVVIIIAFIIASLLAIDGFCDWMEREEMVQQYGYERAEY